MEQPIRRSSSQWLQKRFSKSRINCTIGGLTFMRSFAIIINWTREIGTKRALLRGPLHATNKSIRARC